MLQFLRKIVALPSRRTLLVVLKKVPFSVGVNKHFFKHISQSLTREQDKTCVLLFDEIDIKEQFHYDIGSDRVIGYEDYGREELFIKSANKALVFMCQGLSRNWKKPVAYYFCNNACHADNLIKCVHEVLHAAIHIGGLDVVATICDMGSNNVKALKDLKSSLEHPFFMFEDKQIWTMMDPPHLLKCTVALFRKYNVLLPVVTDDGKQHKMEASFNDIVEAHVIDKKSPLIFRAMYKLKEVHLAPVMRFAMKVGIAAQIMSRTVAA
jgi:hypothetical protein